jgi:hypothetical protein
MPDEPTGLPRKCYADRMESSAYSTEYYEAFRSGSRESAQVIVPMILDWVTPAS